MSSCVDLALKAPCSAPALAHSPESNGLLYRDSIVSWVSLPSSPGTVRESDGVTE